MKFPGLSRVFSILLAVMSLVCIFSGLYGNNGMKTDKINDEYRLKMLEQRTATYDEYSHKLEGEESYATVNARYEELKEEYDKLNAEHRTDLGIYSATQGGLKEGEIQLDGAISQLQDAAGMIDAKEAEISDPNSDLYKQMAAMAAEQARAQEMVKPLVDGLVAVNAGIDTTKSKMNEAITALSSIDAIEGAIASLDPESESYEAEKAAYEAQLAMFPPRSTIEDGITMAESALEQLQNQKDQLETQLEMVDNMAAQAAQQMALEQIQAGKTQLEQGYSALNGAVGKINDMKQELSEDKEKLQNEKEELSIKLDELNELNEKVQQLKHDEKKLTSTRILLESNENIKKSIDNGMDLLSAAENEVERYSADIAKSYKLRFISNILLIISGIIGIVEIPCAFEKINSKLLRKSIPILFAILCAGAQGISMSLGRDNMYSAICAAIIAVICAIFIVPDAKRKAE